MDVRRKYCIIIYMTCALLVQILFWYVTFFYYDEFVPGSSLFRDLTYEEWNWLIQHPSKYGANEAVLNSCMLLRKSLSLFNSMGILHLLFQTDSILPIPKFWKIAIPIGGLVAYLPCYYYMEYQAEYFRLFMVYVPAELLSLILLGLLLAGMWKGRHATPR